MTKMYAVILIVIMSLMGLVTMAMNLGGAPASSCSDASKKPKFTIITNKLEWIGSAVFYSDMQTGTFRRSDNIQNGQYVYTHATHSTLLHYTGGWWYVTCAGSLAAAGFQSGTPGPTGIVGQIWAKGMQQGYSGGAIMSVAEVVTNWIHPPRSKPNMVGITVK